MKIERISENKIRCTLNKDDLVGQEMLLNELAFSPDKAKGLFHELMQKASVEVGFEAQDNPLMVEAIPVSKECLILVITKVDDPDEVKSQYKKMAKNIPGDNIRHIGDKDLFDLFDSTSDTIPNVDDMMESALADSSIQIYTLDSLDEVAHVAKLIHDFPVDSCLYKDEDGQSYYLSLTMPPESESNETLNKIHLVLSEYCRRLTNTYATNAFFKEHLTTVIPKDAVKTMAEY